MRKRNFGLFGLSSLVSILSGCASNLVRTPEENVALRTRQDNVLDRYFAPDAARRLRAEVPVHYAVLDAHWADGASLFSSIDAMWNGWGYEPVIIYNISKKDRLKDSVMVHEPIHFADEFGMIDRSVFSRAQEKARESPEGVYLCRLINTEIGSKYGVISSDTFLAEQIAWWSAYIVNPARDFWGKTVEVPRCVREVYR